MGNTNDSGEPRPVKIDRLKVGSLLRQSISRINIHKGKKLNQIAKHKDDISKHLESGNEMNAKIWCETLLHEEDLIPVYDIVAQMCDQVNGRLSTIEKFGPPKDMNQTFHTLIYAGARMDVDELIEARRQLGKMLGKEFVNKSDTDMTCINKIVAMNLEVKQPEEGQVYLRLAQLANERNIEYRPSNEAMVILNDYCLRKAIKNPLIKGENSSAIQNLNQLPVYNPQPAPPIISNQSFPPGYQPPPAGGGGSGSGMDFQPSYSYQPPTTGHISGTGPATIGQLPSYQFSPAPMTQQQNNYPSMMSGQPPIYNPSSNQNNHAAPSGGGGLTFTVPENQQNAYLHIPSNDPASSSYNNSLNTTAKTNGLSDMSGGGSTNSGFTNMNNNLNNNQISNANNNNNFDKQANSAIDDLEARLEALKRGH